jgi:hypothetical protein
MKLLRRLKIVERKPPFLLEQERSDGSEQIRGTDPWIVSHHPGAASRRVLLPCQLVAYMFIGLRLAQLRPQKHSELADKSGN